jgi:ribosome-associated heat shock protein Hsp15
MADSARLDVWLDVSCVFKTRSEAQRACTLGRITVNGQVAKPHRHVKAGDELVITRTGGRKQHIVVSGVADTHIPKAEARRLYEDRTPPPSTEELELRRLERMFGPKPVQRPDRRSRRDVAKRKWTT